MAEVKIDGVETKPQLGSRWNRGMRQVFLLPACVARADIGDARKLLINLPDSNGETEAVRGLMGHLGACIPNGRKISFSRSVLRAAVAEGLYRLERAANRIPWGAH